MKTERFFVSKEDIITVNENNLVNLNRADGKVYERLEPRRLFPVSRQNSYITLLDDSGIEIAVIKDLNNDLLNALLSLS